MFAVAMLSTALVLAGETKSGMKDTTCTGWLVDQLCAGAPNSIASTGTTKDGTIKVKTLFEAMM